MRNVALLGEPSIVRHQVNLQLRRSCEFHVRLYSLPSVLAEDMKSQYFSAILLLTQKLSFQEVENLSSALDTKLAPPPLFIISDKVDASIRARLSQEKFNVKIVDRLYEMDDLTQMIESSMAGNETGQRREVRYKTRAPVVIQRRNSDFIPGIMENVSGGGAKIKPERLNFMVSERLRLTFFSPSGSERKVSSVVRWINPQQKTIGLQFGNP